MGKRNARGTEKVKGFRRDTKVERE